MNSEIIPPPKSALIHLTLPRATPWGKWNTGEPEPLFACCLIVTFSLACCPNWSSPHLVVQQPLPPQAPIISEPLQGSFLNGILGYLEEHMVSLFFDSCLVLGAENWGCVLWTAIAAGTGAISQGCALPCSWPVVADLPCCHQGYCWCSPYRWSSRSFLHLLCFLWRKILSPTYTHLITEAHSRAASGLT